jgi:hypothetical protein
VAATQVFLIALSLVAEVFGIGLAVREVIQRRTHVQNYRERPHVGEGLREHHLAREGAGRGSEPPSVEERLDALERSVEAMREEVPRAEGRALEQAKEHAARVVDDAQATAHHEVDGVRQLLLHVTEPNRDVWTSLGLFVLGVALESLASALGVQG